MTSAQRIVLALRRQGWSKSKLGRALGISQASISQLTNGKYPGTHHFPRIAQVLDVPEEWLRTGYPEPPWVTSLLINTEAAEDAAPAPGKTAKTKRTATPTATTHLHQMELLRRLKEAERERDELRERVRRLESTAAWQADQLREIQDRRATTPDVSAG